MDEIKQIDLLSKHERMNTYNYDHKCNCISGTTWWCRTSEKIVADLALDQAHVDESGYECHWCGIEWVIQRETVRHKTMGYKRTRIVLSLEDFADLHLSEHERTNTKTKGK